jgi:hypothetical protein
MIEGKPLLPEGSPFELWDVRLTSGDVKLSIDELDAAFESGLVDRNTLVRRRGTVRWATLAEAANLDASDEPPVTTAAPTPRPAVPRPTATRRTLPPPLPPSVAAPLPTVVVESASIERPLEPTPHVSSLPPPMTVSMTPSMALEDLRSKEDALSSLDDTAAAIAALHPRSKRRRTFAALCLLTFIGAATAAWMKFPAVGNVIATAVHLKSSAPSANGVAAPAPPPAAATALPAPSAAPSSTPAPSSAPAPEPVKTHPLAASSASKIVTAPAKPSRTTKPGTKVGASPAVGRH